MLRLEIAKDVELRSGDVELTAEALAIRIDAGRHRSLIWSRPLRLQVRTAGEIEFVPIHDSTRMLQIGIWLVALAALMICRAAIGRGKGGSRERRRRHHRWRIPEPLNR